MSPSESTHDCEPKGLYSIYQIVHIVNRLFKNAATYYAQHGQIKKNIVPAHFQADKNIQSVVTSTQHIKCEFYGKVKIVFEY